MLLVEVGEAPERQQQQKQKKQVEMSIATTSSNSKLLDHDDKQRRGRSSSGVAYERPLIAVPFKWEAEPGVPKLNKAGQSPNASPKLAPPPRLLQKDNAAAAAAAANSKPSPLLSPRSPRSISLSKKMRSLLQGKLSMYSNSRRISDERISSSPYGSEESSSSSLFWEAMGDSDSAPDTEESVQMHVKHMLYNAVGARVGDSDHIVLEGEQLNLRMDEPRSSNFSDPPVQQQSRPGFMPFKNMSTMLLELWYNGGSVSSGCVDSSEGHRILNGGFDISPGSSSSSDSVESPGSYNSSSSSFSSDYDNHPPPPRYFKPVLDEFGKDEGYEQLPKKFQNMDFDEHDYRDEDDFSIDFDYCSSRDFLLAEKLYRSDRFRVESSESASLCRPVVEHKQEEDLSDSVHDERLLSSVQLQRQPLPSALKSGKRGSSSRNSMKRVRFADDGLPSSSSTESEEQEVCSPKFSPVLERYSSRPASRFSDEDDYTEDSMPSAAEDESSSPSYSSPSPSPRPRRDLSELFMQIVQADAEITRRQKRGAFKSMFRSTKRY